MSNAVQQAMNHYLRAGYAYGWQHAITDRYYAVYRRRWFVGEGIVETPRSK